MKILYIRIYAFSMYCQVETIRVAPFGKFRRKYLATFQPNGNRQLKIQMFGLSVELISKGELATVKRFALTKG